MIVFIAAGALVVIGLAAALAMGRLSRMSVQAPDPVTSVGGHPLPDRDFTAADIDHLRFDVAFRGYRMSEVDAAIGALQRRIMELEDEGLGMRHGAPVLGAAGALPGAVHRERGVSAVEPAEDDGFPGAAPIPLRPHLQGHGHRDTTFPDDGPAS